MTNSKRLFSILPLNATIFTFQETEEYRVGCYFTSQVTLENYYILNRNSLFNLKPELRGSLSSGEFQPDRPIQITATLQPDLLPQLAEFQTGEQVLAHLKNLAETQPDHPLLDTENWYALQVKQTLDDGETGYRTLWDYVNLAAIAQGELSSADITDRMVQFFRDQMQASPTDFNQNSLESSLDEITRAFDQWLENSLDEGDRAIDEAIEEATSAFDELIDNLSEAVDEFSTASLYESIIQFFTEDDWSFTKIQGEPILRMAFQGENGTYICYAKVRESEGQFVFYSICPLVIPEEKRGVIAEFIARANYGMIIGNFELDFEDGEVRYKTSIDVTDDQLTLALVKSLVYTNVLTMDRYLLGIRAVLEEGLSAIAAIQHVEAPESNASELRQSTVNQVSKA
jgi:hypothetical protein